MICVHYRPALTPGDNRDAIDDSQVAVKTVHTVGGAPRRRGFVTRAGRVFRDPAECGAPAK